MYVYLPGIFLGDVYIRAWFTAVYAYMCYLQRYVCMYICRVTTYSEGKNQPGKVANPARGQLAEQGTK